MPQPKIPLNIQKLYRDMLEPVTKSTALDQGEQSPAGAVMDWVADQSCSAPVRPAVIQSDYRVDIFRRSGNQMFRRFHDGSLDIEAATIKVLAIVEKAKDQEKMQSKGLLTDMDLIVLSVYFPGLHEYAYPLVAAKMAMSQLNLTPQEAQLVASRVALRLSQIMQNIKDTSGTNA